MTGKSPPADANRSLELDGLRGIAILLVVLQHTYFRPEMLTGLPEEMLVRLGTEMTEGRGVDFWFGRLANVGWAGVDLFFVLSGFLITGILLRSKERPHYLKNFFARRALRSLLLQYATVLYQLLLGTGGELRPWEKVAYLTCWPNLRQAAHPAELGHNPFLGVTWLLAIEEQF